jgi:AhpD family alkylhydroperoxidase
MTARLELTKADPGSYQAMKGLQTYVNESGLESSLLGLVELRSSQINGCAFCIDMHSKDARARGETEQRIYALDAWRETPFFSGRERAALSWTESVTLIGDGHVPDVVYREAREHFSEGELIKLTLAIVVINGWNRLCIAFRVPPGTHRPSKRAT